MEHIANAANISKSSLYHHDSGKEELLGIALRRAITALFATLETVRRANRHRGRMSGWPRAGGDRDRVASGAGGVPAEQAPRQPATEELALAERRRYDETVTGLVRESQQEGAAPDDIDPALLTRLVLGMTTSLIE